jgi:hypothetical protein
MSITIDAVPQADHDRAIQAQQLRILELEERLAQLTTDPDYIEFLLRRAAKRSPDGTFLVAAVLRENGLRFSRSEMSRFIGEMKERGVIRHKHARDPKGDSGRFEIAPRPAWNAWDRERRLSLTAL